MPSNDVFEITNPELLERIQGIKNGTIKDVVISGKSTEIASQVTGTLSGGELANIVDGNYEVPINDGTVNFMHYEGTGFVDAPVTSTTSIQRSTPAGPISQYNSNVTAIQRGRVVQPYNASVADGKVTLSSTPASGSFGANAAYFLGEVNQAVCAAQVGIMLGKTIDSVLYNANPDFWDSAGMSSLNPETWNAITHGDDSLGASLFNMIFGLNPDTNMGQAYIDQNALAYMAYYMAQNGIFDSPQYEARESDTSKLYNVNLPQPIPFDTTINLTAIYAARNVIETFTLISVASTSPVYFVYNASGTGLASDLVGISENPFSFTFSHYDSTYGQTTTRTIASSDRSGSKIFKTKDGTPYHASTLFDATRWSKYNYIFSGAPAGYALGSTNIVSDLSDIAQCILFGQISGGTTIDGISNQPNATLPDASSWHDIPSTLSSLQNQYPNIFNDSITYNQIQPDGSLKPTTYVPVGFPNTVSNPWTDTKPTTTNQTTTQTNPQIDLDDLSDDETSPLTRTLTQTPTQNPNPDTDVPQNPNDTGDGSTPVPIVPIGSASALWSVYHPTQAQVNSFGAWLWGSPFLTNIGKLFQNPIEGVISLHKVFAPPVDSGSGNIVVGTLDSGVASATVNQQYVEVDCGSVILSEDFGNVFDYDPYTKVALYLPFVGIVPLNVADVMRSTINVKYGVDIFTGACIAMVSVSRDGNDAVLYQYSGNCAVHYPLSNVQQSQLLNGLIAIAAGIGSIVATAGAAAPSAAAGIAGAAGAAGGAVSALHSNVGRSGGFSANAGAMGIKVPYLIIERPQAKVAQTFPELAGYPTNYSCKLGECSGHVVVKHAHIEGINATDNELEQIDSLLKDGVIV